MNNSVKSFQVEFVKNRWIFYIFSGILTIISALAIFVWGLNPGIDFVGGSLIEIKTPKKIDNLEEIASQFKKTNLGEVSIQTTEAGVLLVRTKITEGENLKKIRDVLKEKIGDYEVLRQETIGPSLSNDILKKAIWMVSVGILGIIFYVSWSFRQVPKPVSSWVLAVATIVALIHDLIITLGVFALFNHLFAFEATSFIIVSVLTILGFSVHDSIVVLDRLRENLIKKFSTKGEIGETINQSLNQTLARSFNTSLTVILALVAVLLFGGASIRPFVATLLVGITIGTYSSIFIAAQLVASWYARKKI